MWALTYQPVQGQARNVTWIKSLDELLVPNGQEPLIVWMMRECEERDLAFVLTHLSGVSDTDDPPIDPPPDRERGQ